MPKPRPAHTHTHPHSKLRLKRPLALALGAVAGLLLLAYGTIFWIESEAGQRFIEHRASSATGREVKIGTLDIKVGWHPGIRVSGLRVSNPAWAKTRDLIDAELIDARIRLIPLITGRVIIDDLTLVQTKAGLEHEENRNTWSLREQPQSADDKPSRVAVRRINVDRGFVVYRDTTIQTNMEIDVTGDVGAGGALDLSARGTFRGQKARAVARIPGAMPTPDTAVEMSAAATLGDITAAAAGTNTRG